MVYLSHTYMMQVKARSNDGKFSPNWSPVIVAAGK